MVSSDSGRRDQGIEAQDAGVASILHYAFVESSRVGLMSMHRQTGDSPCTENSLSVGDTLTLSALGIEIPVAEFYEDVELGP